MFQHTDCLVLVRRARSEILLPLSLLAAGAAISACGGSSSSRNAPLGSGGSQGRLEVESAANLTIGGPRGGPFAPQEAMCRLKNDGETSLYWTPDSAVEWLRATPTAGQLTPGQSVEVRVHVDAERAAALEPGCHRGELRFLDRSRGRCAASIAVDLWVGVVLEAGSWLRVQAKKEFPIFVWHEIPTSTWIAYWRGLGIDTYLGSSSMQVETSELLDLLHEQDMYGVVEFDARSSEHPALLAWTLDDGAGIDGPSVEGIREECLAIRALDRTRPTVTAWTDTALDGAISDALHSLDGLLSLRGADPAEAPPNVEGAAQVSEPIMAAHGARPRPSWSLIALDEGAAARSGVSTENWLRHRVWTELVRGATGIGYATHLDSPDALPSLSSAFEGELARIHAAIRELTGVLCSSPPDIKTEVQGESAASVSWMLREWGDSVWLFAVDETSDPRGADFRFAFEQSILSVEDWFESRVLASSDKSFSDHLAPLGVRIYRIRLQPR